MTKYICHGGATTLQISSNKSFFKEIVKDVPVNGTILLVYFAARNDDYVERLEYDAKEFEEAAGEKIVQIVVAEKERFIEQIKGAHAVYFRGGSTQKSLETLKQYPDLKEYFEDKTVAGSSAGAYTLSTFYSSHYEDIIEEGLGIVPARVVTHYKSEKMPPKARAVEALKSTHEDLRLIILEEGEWEIVNL